MTGICCLNSLGTQKVFKELSPKQKSGDPARPIERRKGINTQMSLIGTCWLCTQWRAVGRPFTGPRSPGVPVFSLIFAPRQTTRGRAPLRGQLRNHSAWVQTWVLLLPICVGLRTLPSTFLTLRWECQPSCWLVDLPGRLSRTADSQRALSGCLPLRPLSRLQFTLGS